MKRILITPAIMLVFAMMLTMSGCAKLFVGEATEDDTNKLLTPEDIESIFASISDEVTEKYPISTDTLGNELCYWLKGGDVWHASSACASIARADADAVFSGSIDDAISAGKKRGCKICSDGATVEDTEDHQSEAQTDQTGAETRVDTDLEDETVDAGDDTTEKTSRYTLEYDEDGRLIVFWLESGSVWHSSRHCSSLARSDPTKICSGYVEDARASGKERACKKCS